MWIYFKIMMTFHDIGLNSRKVRKRFFVLYIVPASKVIIPSIIGRSGHFLQDMDICDRNLKRSYSSSITSPFFM